MKAFIGWLCLCAFSWLIVACADPTPSADTTCDAAPALDATSDDGAADGAAPDADGGPRQLRVLFVGNSYTYVNDLPVMLRQLAATAPEPVTLEVAGVLAGGAAFWNHWSETTARARIAEGGWDYVVLQGQSVEPLSDPSNFTEFGEKLAAEATRAGALPVFFATWARRADDPVYGETGYYESYGTMTADLHDAYADVARRSGARVAPVGYAWQASLAEHPAIALHDPDRSHPSLAGTYLAACVFHATLFGASPEGAGYTAGLEVEHARALQRVAARVARGEFPRTDPALQIAAGYEHACAVRTSGKVACWGRNVEGERTTPLLGDGETHHQDCHASIPGWQDCSPVPVTVSSLTDAVQVGVGGKHACARRASGAVVCWGDNAAGQLGDGTTVGRATPVTVRGLADAVAIATGSVSNCALRASGEVVCWGAERGHADRLLPVAVPGLTDVRQISVGGSHACALRTDGHVMCWGTNDIGELGNGTHGQPPQRTPVEVLGLADAAKIAAGTYFTCALRTNGHIACWGYGALGNGTSNMSSIPTSVVGLTDATELTSGYHTACARRASGAVLCWGDNEWGQIGDDSLIGARNAPVAVMGLEDALAVAAGGYFVCAQRANGAVLCWGRGADGERGDRSLLSRRTPSGEVHRL